MRRSPKHSPIRVGKGKRCRTADESTRSAADPSTTRVLPGLRDYMTLPGLREVYFMSQTGGWLGVHKRFNQDCYFDVARGTSRLIGVCDGHGSHGHTVARFVSKRLPAVVHRLLLWEKEGVTPSEKLIKAYEKCLELLEMTAINTSQSGCTCLSLLQTENVIICGNVGDSRAVVGRHVNGVWSAYQLSTDHRVDSTVDRICVGEETGDMQCVYQNRQKVVPGLVLTRSLGDSIAAKMGVSSTPTIELFNPSASDKFVIFATRGLWEVMSNLEIVTFVGEMYTQEPQNVAERLTNEAQRRWRDRGDRVEDVTVGFAVIDRIIKTQ